jgi:chromosome partitioning protein
MVSIVSIIERYGMILLVGGQKGGTGKSTISTNIAAWHASRGKDVLLIDGNPTQGTASNWAARREDVGLPPLTCIEKSGNLFRSVRDLSERYDEVIIDTGGQDSKECRTALLAADVFLTPIRPSQTDAETLIFVSELIEQAMEINPGLKSKILITNALTNPGSKTVDEIRELVKDMENFELLNSVIHARKIYIDAIPGGHGVVELNNKKAKQEIEALTREIYA